MALRDLDRADAGPDPFGAGEPAGFGVPLPRREMNPAMAGDGQREIDRPAKASEYRLLLGADQAASKACDRSARMSSSCSIPIDSRT